MKKLRLDVKKIENQLILIGKSKTWLAAELKISKQLLNYHLQSNTIAGAELIAPVFGLNPKDLIQ